MCEICGRTESGWDFTCADVDMVECVNGHIFCQSEMLPLPSKEELIKMIVDNEMNIGYYDPSEDCSVEELHDMDKDELFSRFCSDNGYYNVPECVCPICQFVEYSEHDMSRYLEKEYHVSREEVFENVKQFNKRRKKLYDSEYITEVCRRFNLNLTEIVASLKDRFGTYAAFRKYLRVE